MLSRVYPSQASADLTPSSTSTGDNALSFGFPAAYIRLVNQRAAAVFVRFDSSTPSTAGYRTCAGEELVFNGPLCSQVAVASTTTSTGTIVRVLALGG